jgi:hypothetical protein
MVFIHKMHCAVIQTPFDRACAFSGVKNEHFHLRIEILQSTNLKLFKCIKGNSVNIYDFFKVHGFLCHERQLSWLTQGIIET